MGEPTYERWKEDVDRDEWTGRAGRRVVDGGWRRRERGMQDCGRAREKTYLRGQLRWTVHCFLKAHCVIFTAVLQLFLLFCFYYGVGL